MLIGGALVTVLLLGASAAFAFFTWGEVNRVSLDRPEPDTSSGPVASEEDPPVDDGEDDDDEIPLEVVGRQVVLLVGSDSREDLDDTEGFGDFEGQRADVIMVLIKDGDRTAVLSIPRDLLVENPCGGIDDRISAMLGGCESLNGPTLLTLAVEDQIGLTVDHFAMIDFLGFQETVDALGGYEICVENEVRDIQADLSLPAGCTLADGEQTLAWMRSRHTQELTDSGWRTMPGINDLVRNERQRKFLIDMMSSLSDVTSPQDIASVAQAVAPFVTVDSELSLPTAVNIAWTMRGLGSDAIEELEVPVYDATTEQGASVLLASRSPEEIVADFLSGTVSSAEAFLDLAS